MSFENGNEKGTSSSGGADSSIITLQKAVELGEYEPKILSRFAEWDLLSNHARFQLVRRGLDNHERQLVQSWADMNNILDFSKKPHIREALDNIQKQIHKVQFDRERLYIEFSRIL